MAGTRRQCISITQQKSNKSELSSGLEITSQSNIGEIVVNPLVEMIHLKVGRKSLLLLKYEFGESKKMRRIWEAVMWSVIKNLNV